MYPMSRGIQGRRRYDSTRRAEQARLTRRSILEAARHLFLKNGYAATTVGAVAKRAGVSVETVYKSFGNKVGLVKAVFDVAIVGDDEPIPMLQRELVRRIEAEPDPRRMFMMYGDHLAKAGPRAGRIQLLIRSAGATDPEAHSLWKELLGQRLYGMSAFAHHLHEGGHLRPGISVEDARDILWTYNSVELYDLLVLERGWEPERYGRWIAEALIAALLPRD
jgi:AcrR family transcriptional regulator